MRREQFEHAIRAAGAVLGVNEVLVIGSQALHGSVRGALPAEVSRSVEVDIAAMHDTDGRLADLIDGSVGDVAWCLDPHDLWLSKAIAGRPKDLEFCLALIGARLVNGNLLRRRLADVIDLDDKVRAIVLSRIPA